MLLLSEAQMEVARLLAQLSLADRFFLSSFLSLASSLFALFSILSSVSSLSSLFSSLPLTLYSVLALFSYHLP
jgi:hypothetical protein